jgi:hypothetical protein
MNTRNRTNVVWINTELHRCTAMEEDVSYPLESRSPTPATARRRDFSALRLVLAITLVAAGCALLITAGCPPAVGL